MLSSCFNLQAHLQRLVLEDLILNSKIQLTVSCAVLYDAENLLEIHSVLFYVFLLTDTQKRDSSSE